jgi:multidrug efflux pump subunit AcrA (membrane-fusion protein)
MRGRTRPLRPLAALICLVSPLTSQAGEIYKSVDAQGHVVYSDHADSSAQKTDVQVDLPDAKEVARNAKQQAILKAENDARSKQAAVDAAKKAKLAQERQAQCDAARNRYYAMKDARRLFQRDADGNRIFYSDADADARREDARQTMLAACEQ